MTMSMSMSQSTLIATKERVSSAESPGAELNAHVKVTHATL